MTLYMSRSSAIRAARHACRLALGPYFEAAEGPDFIICPRHIPMHDVPDVWRAKSSRLDLGDRWSFELCGPAANPNDEDKANAAASWTRYKEKTNARHV